MKIRQVAAAAAAAVLVGCGAAHHAQGPRPGTAACRDGYALFGYTGGSKIDRDVSRAPAGPEAHAGHRSPPSPIIQADPYNTSRLSTTLAAVITPNTGLAAMPSNVFVAAATSGLPKDSVVNVTALVTLDKAGLDDVVRQLPPTLMSDVDRGLRRVLGL